MESARQRATGAADATGAAAGEDELIVRTQREGDEVLIHVIDTGPGIDEVTAAKIFQPYYSSKPSGTGLGLPTTRRIVEEHGGSVHVHTEPGRGSDFTITLPAEPPV
jgi:signal transduction histidine kinase